MKVVIQRQDREGEFRVSSEKRKSDKGPSQLLSAMAGEF